ncbi:zinc ABC transporter permease AztB [Microbacterium halophytorum]|uniref:zinc ABC transporter permease AztB n=1 Tax=Microbacterium halophytorum TaxID=2067568 RepID=UPI000CFD4DF9|nr:zinc ABC transporter permease AztB [Microbacterium halophytorum]
MLDLPFSSEFMLRALVGGSLVAIICAIVGTWVVVRGMAFLGEAIGHGMLPGVAIATLVGAPPLWGAAISGAAMSGAIGLLQRRGRLSWDTSIGLLFVGMLSLGVIIVSHSRSFATDATNMLFGDILAIGWGDIATLSVALVVVASIAVAFHRSFIAAAFDRRVAHTLGMRPRLAHTLLTALVTIAVIASYQSVGSLLVVGMLLAPAVAAGRWARSLPSTMALAAVFGIAAVATGLTVSWYAATAAGPTIACTAIVFAGLSALTAGAWHRSRTARAGHLGAESAPAHRTAEPAAA